MTSTEKAGGNLLQGPVNRTLLATATPIGLGMLSTFLFQVVDTYFVGQLGAAELAALSFSSPVYLLLMAGVIGLAAGVATVVAKAIGEGRLAEARRLAFLAVVLVAALSAGLCAAAYHLVGPTFRLLGASDEIVGLAAEYMRVLYLGMPLVMVALVGGAVLRAMGEAKWPEVVMMVAGVLNLVFDYLLIFGKGPFPRLGLAGAAGATTLSWAFVFVAMTAMLLRRRALGVAGLAVQRVLGAYRELLRIGVPSIATQLLAPATMAYVIWVMARLGADAVAGFGIAGRVQSLALVGVFGVGTAVTPFIAQNLGAGNRRRIDDAVVFAGKAATYWGVGVFVLLAIFAAPIARLFSDATEVQEVTRLYFYVVAASYAPLGLISVTAAIFNGVLEPAKALRILFVKAIVLTAPLVFLGALWGLIGVFAGMAASNLLGAFYAARVMKRHLATVGSELVSRRPLADYASDLSVLVGCRP